MAAAKKSSTGIDDTERARAAPESEAASLTTTAVTMFLSVLAAAEAAKREDRDAAARADASAPSTTSDADSHHAAVAQPDAAPPEPEHHAGAGGASAAPDHAATLAPLDAGALHESSASMGHAAALSTLAETGGHVALTPDLTDATPLSSSFSPSGGTGATTTSSAGSTAGHEFGVADLDGLQSSLQDTIQDTLQDTIQATLHDAMTGLSTLASDIGAGLQHQLSSLTPDLSALNGTIAETVNSATHLAMAAPEAAAGSLISGVFGGSGSGSATADTVHTLDAAHGALDTGGAIPVSADHAPLQLSFMGQPHIDGHDLHDGAFSALGIHTF
jgi:hypothetical protein